MSLDFVEAGEFVDELSSEMPWVIEPLLMKGSSMMLYGRQKVGKSSVTFQLMDALINGEPWLGFPVRKTGSVIYLQLDMAQMEMKRVIERATERGLSLRKGLYVPKPAKGEHRVMFNILDPTQEKQLADWCEQIKPVAVVVDTINDAYEEMAKVANVNSFIRDIHKRFMRAIGDAALIFLNHKRKQMQSPKGDEVDDEDGYLGGSAWAGVVASNLELARSKKSGQIFLVLRDLRLDTYPAKLIPLAKDANGFFEAQISSQQMLLMWPEGLPSEEKKALLNEKLTMNAIFADIAKRCGTSPDAVKKQYQRAANVDYPWKKLLGDVVKS